jgi:cytochrome c-type biogenesis protein CcmE
MKKIHIVILLVACTVAGILVATYTSALSSTDFATARTKSGEMVTITGTLDKSKPVQYDANVNPDLTAFSVIDNKGACEQVVLIDKSGKPMGLEMSESVTLQGKYSAANHRFEASYMQMKCPSKYNESKHELSSQAQ